MNFSIFENKNKLLPAFSKPYPGELLSSWMARLAFNHGLALWDFLRVFYGATAFSKHNIDFCGDSRIQQLALRTNCSFEEVKNTTLHYYENAIFSNGSQAHQVLRGWVLSRNLRETSKNTMGLMYCPKCLSGLKKKPAYFRKQWRLGISFVCLKCRCYLMENCPHCNEFVSFLKPFDPGKDISEYLTTCKYCKRSICDNQIITAPEGLLDLQKQLYDIIDHGCAGKGVYPISYFKALRQVAALFATVKYTHIVRTPRELELDPFIQDVIAAHKRLFPILHQQLADERVQGLSVYKRAYKIMLAHWLLEDWPKRFLHYCKQSKINRSQILYLSYHADTPFWFWDTVYSNLLPPIPSIGTMPFGCKHSVSYIFEAMI
jgi:hypothetical protein